LAQYEAAKRGNKFGTSDNFKAGSYAAGFDQRTDGFSKLQNN